MVMEKTQQKILTNKLQGSSSGYFGAGRGFRARGRAGVGLRLGGPRWTRALDGAVANLWAELWARTQPAPEPCWETHFTPPDPYKTVQAGLLSGL